MKHNDKVGLTVRFPSSHTDHFPLLPSSMDRHRWVLRICSNRKLGPGMARSHPSGFHSHVPYSHFPKTQLQLLHTYNAGLTFNRSVT